MHGVLQRKRLKYHDDMLNAFRHQPVKQEHGRQSGFWGHVT